MSLTTPPPILAHFECCDRLGMNALLAGYQDSSDEDSESGPVAMTGVMSVNAAPPVPSSSSLSSSNSTNNVALTSIGSGTMTTGTIQSRSRNSAPSSSLLLTNPTQRDLASVVVTASQPITSANKNLAGWYQSSAVDGSAFDREHVKFVEKTKGRGSSKKRKREKGSSNSGDLTSWKGPWAEFESSEPVSKGINPEDRKRLEDAGVIHYGQKRARAAVRAASILSATGGEVGKESAALVAAATTATTGISSTTTTNDTTTTTTTTTTATINKGKDPIPERQRGPGVTGKETTTLHASGGSDDLGRTYMVPPSDSIPRGQVGAIPKRMIAHWTGHTAGVNAARFFPGSGHIVLSAGLDGKVKLWSVYGKRDVLRTVSGHSKGVRDVAWSHDGRVFASASYDKTVRVWDSETGQCLAALSNGKVPYVVAFNPNPELGGTTLLAGTHDRKIMHWDYRTGDTVQTYDQHLSAVNTINFVDEGRRFVTTSDDKSVRVWEWEVPVSIKSISEPHMHSMPAVTKSPSGAWLLATSLDNQILVYSGTDRYTLNKKKRFSGHSVAGYACQVAMSPDESYVASGDSSGSIWVWDWKHCKRRGKWKAHDKVAIGCEWHPFEPSTMVTCSWDGSIKLWK